MTNWHFKGDIGCDSHNPCRQFVVSGLGVNICHSVRHLKSFVLNLRPTPSPVPTWLQTAFPFCVYNESQRSKWLYLEYIYPKICLSCPLTLLTLTVPQSIAELNDTLSLFFYNYAERLSRQGDHCQKRGGGTKTARCGKGNTMIKKESLTKTRNRFIVMKETYQFVKWASDVTFKV